MEQSIGKKIAEGMLLVIYISALMYVICHKGELSFGNDVSNEYLLYFHHSKIGWGIFGAVIGEALMLIGSSKAPAVAILVICIFLSFMFLTGFTLIKLYKWLEKPAKKVGDKIEKAKQERALYEEEEDEDDELDEVPKRRRKGHLYVYSEADLLNTEDTQETEEAKPEETIVEEVKTEESVPEEKVDADIQEIRDIFAVAAEKQAAEEEK